MLLVAAIEGIFDESVEHQTDIQNFRQDKKTELYPADRQRKIQPSLSFFPSPRGTVLK